MSFLQIYGYCVIGIILSVILPIVKQSLPKPKKSGVAGPQGWLPRVWKIAKPFIVVGVYSLIAALLVVAFLGQALQDWRTALLAGYACDSTIQKIR